MNRTFLAAALALTVAACAPVPYSSQALMTRSLFSPSVVGGPEFPVVISGAEYVGLTPDVIAQNLRFPRSLRADSSFSAASHPPRLINHAHLDIGQDGTSILTFLHGERRIGAGRFTIPPQEYANPDVLGSTSATLIGTMLRNAQNDLRDSDKPIWILRD